VYRPLLGNRHLAVPKPLVDQHGADAPTVAAMRADELLDRGDLEGQGAWKRIARATEELLSTEPSGNVH
jgi:hypothetical protein